MTDRFKTGVQAAAGVIEGFNGCTTHAYRLDDVILCKLNVTKRKLPRKNKRKLQVPGDAWICGLATGLAEMHRRLLNGNDSSGVVEVARNCGLTLALAKSAGVTPFDWKELKRAGVK